jgi:ribosomal protein L36
MKLPRYKLDGRTAALISTQPDGQPWRRTGRLMVIWDEWLQAVLAGTSEGAGMVSLASSRNTSCIIEATPAEARDALLQRLGGPLAARKCENIRRRRMAAGALVCGVLEDA